MNTTGIWSEGMRLGGKPCIRKHRFSMAQLMAELADGGNLKQIAEDFDIDYDIMRVAWSDLVDELCLLKINTDHIMSDQKGVNCLQGRGISISIMLTDLLVENRTVEEEATKFVDLDKDEIEGMLRDLAMLLDQDWTGGPPKNLIGGST